MKSEELNKDDYYVVYWLTGHNKIYGWSIHESIQEADDLKQPFDNIFKYKNIYIVTIKLPDFDKVLFKAKLSKGYYMVEGVEPPIWMEGSRHIDKKIAFLQENKNGRR